MNLARLQIRVVSLQLNPSKSFVNITLKIPKIHFNYLFNSYYFHSKTSKSITLRVPPWNFVAVTRNTDAQRLYIKVRPEHKFDTTIKIRPLSGLLSVNYSQLKEQADKIVNIL